MATRKLIATALRGERAEEALIREAKAEVDAAASGADVAVESTPAAALPSPNLGVTALEALDALAPLFLTMEKWLVVLREKSHGKLIISTEEANVFLNAQAVLKKAKWEQISHRAGSPITFLPVIAKAKS